MILLVQRFSRTFRERAPEWVMATIQAGWGISLLMPGDTFARPFYKPLKAMAPETAWGMACLLVGSARLAALYVNGSRTQTPRIRQVCSFFAMWFWMMLTVGTMSLDWLTPAVFTYAGLFTLDAIMFSYSGSDATRVALKASGYGRRV